LVDVILEIIVADAEHVHHGGHGVEVAARLLALEGENAELQGVVMVGI